MSDNERPANWLLRVIAEASMRVALWPDWKRNSGPQKGTDNEGLSQNSYMGRFDQ